MSAFIRLPIGISSNSDHILMALSSILYLLEIVWYWLKIANFMNPTCVQHQWWYDPFKILPSFSLWYEYRVPTTQHSLHDNQFIRFHRIQEYGWTDRNATAVLQSAVGLWPTQAQKINDKMFEWNCGPSVTKHAYISFTDNTDKYQQLSSYKGLATLTKEWWSTWWVIKRAPFLFWQ